MIFFSNEGSEALTYLHADFVNKKLSLNGSARAGSFYLYGISVFGCQGIAISCSSSKLVSCISVIVLCRIFYAILFKWIKIPDEM